ncbi:carbonic anhydrase 2-like isoform X3 [Ahaetulla prasina]|uniref:carbonic anhydrase 2-like isoform X3 n=1 Tax=Ahaetulla prasina TaxID=499056 RepID=UPI002648330E|nr:carbonic anhydrase 2-like isoform X3 [Ahaetulla prasina]
MNIRDLQNSKLKLAPGSCPWNAAEPAHGWLARLCNPIITRLEILISSLTRPNNTHSQEERENCGRLGVCLRSRRIEQGGIFKETNSSNFWTLAFPGSQPLEENRKTLPKRSNFPRLQLRKEPSGAGTMGSAGFSLKLSACILIFLILENFCVTCDSHWCYDDPKCGPNTWGSIGSCSGKKQSPININTKTVKYKPIFELIHFTNYENVNIAKTVKNTGHHLQVDFKPKATISGPGFSGIYYLWQFHFHWGTQNSNGAEHTINGERYAMEMHLVHTKNNMTIEEASKQSDGIVVLSFFIQVNIMTTSLYFTTIQENRPMQNNFRPLQPLNGREVYYYTEHKSLFNCVGYCF